MDLHLTFLSTTRSYGSTELQPAPVTMISNRLDTIMEEVVAPGELVSIDVVNFDIVATVFIRRPQDVQLIVQDITYDLPPEDRYRLGLPALDVDGIGQDTWGQSDLSLDMETARLLGRDEDSDFVPILISYAVTPSRQ